MPKPKPKRTKKPEPERYYEHPYIPGDTKELFGKEILWLEKDEYVDWSMEPVPDSTVHAYKEEYRGKFVIRQAAKDSETDEDPLYFHENGTLSNILYREIIEAYLEDRKGVNRTESKLEKATATVDDLTKDNDSLQNQIHELLAMKERLSEENASIHDDLETAERRIEILNTESATVDGNTNNLRDAVGGEPKEVLIKW